MAKKVGHRCIGAPENFGGFLEQFFLQQPRTAAFAKPLLVIKV